MDGSGGRCVKDVTRMSLLVVALAGLIWTGVIEGKTHPVDIEVLQQILAETNASSIIPSSCLSSWNFSADPCDFSSTAFAFICGIHCDAGAGGLNRRVISLALDSPGYTGSLSPFIGNLSGLQVLDISGNYYSGFIPESLGGLSNLVKLDLSGNLLSGVVPRSLGRLTNLLHISFANNGLLGSIPESMNNLVNLTHLYLFNNKLNGSVPALNNLTHLAYFDASNNNFTGALTSELPPSLVLLSLKSNQLTGNLPAALTSQSYLAVLDVSDNQLTGDLDSSLFMLPNFQQANFSGNRFTGLMGTNISAFASQLVALDISFNGIDGDLPAFIADMPKLSALSMRYNLFSGSIPYEYGVKASVNMNGGQLARLWLDGNYLIGRIPSPFIQAASEGLVGSFIDNCLQSCPHTLTLCQGGEQKSPALCDTKYTSERSM